MNQKLTVILAAGVLWAGVAVYAGGGCCAASRQLGASTDKVSACDDTLSKLNLTDEQKTKLADLKAEATKANWTADAHAKYMKGIEALLTPAQLTDWKAACEKMSKGAQCPFKSDKADTKS